MLTAEMASTTAKPSMILARNRNVGSLTDIDCGQTRFDSPTRTPVVLPIPSRNRERELPDSMLKPRAEWIRGRKFAPSPHRGAPSKPGWSQRGYACVAFNGQTLGNAYLRGPGRGGLWRRQCLPMRGQLQLRLGQRLQLLERHVRNHLDHEQSLRRHIDHREVGVNPLHAAGRGERIGASL